MEEKDNVHVKLGNGAANSNCIFDSDEEALQGQIQAWNFTFAFASSMALKASCLLGIPDILAREGKGASLSAKEIAAHLPSKAPNVDYLFRLLRFLSSNGVFSAESVVNSDGGGSETKYGLTPLSKWLVSGNNFVSMAPLILMQIDKVSQAPWHHINESILDGGSAFEKAHGIDVWSFLNQNARFNSVFNNGMVSSSELSMRTFLNIYGGLKDLRTLVDVGGGLGKAVSRIVQRYPYIKGINYDLPHVVAMAPTYPGVVHISGDMFDFVPSGDAIFMKWIMHDWEDTDCIKILKNCKRALPTNGKLIILDVVLDEEESPFSQTRLIFDLIMIAHTGGRERTEEQWKGILFAAGFLKYNITHLPMAESIIEAFPS